VPEFVQARSNFRGISGSIISALGPAIGLKAALAVAGLDEIDALWPLLRRGRGGGTHDAPAWKHSR